MVWEWPSPRNFFLLQGAKESVEVECLLPMAPVSSGSVRCGTVGQLSDSIEVISAAASAVSTVASVSQIVEHEVQRGDWLCDICRRHNVDLRSLLKANPSLRNPNSLRVGIRIKIPCTSSTTGCFSPGRRQSSSLQEPVLQEVSAVKSSALFRQPEGLTISNVILLVGSMLLQRREYKVMEGDSLELIADKYGTSISALKRLNNLKDDMIYAGSVLKIEKCQRLKGCKQLHGRRLSVRERGALLEDILFTLPQPVKGPASINPSFKTYPLLQRGPHLSPLPRLKTVKVQFGDTLANIAYKHGLGIGELQRLNNLRSDVIYEGDVLAVSPDPMKRSCLELRVGKRRTHRFLFSRYSQSAGGPVEAASDESASKAKHSVVGRWERKIKVFQRQEGRWPQFGSPVIDGFVSSPFGWRWGALHEGVDLAAEQGAPIFASDRGTVTFAGWRGGYGYLIVIQHEGGFVTQYAHCCAIHARVGQQVSKGQQVAAVGATGRATGPHLHFEVRRNGEALDPLDWVKL